MKNKLYITLGVAGFLALAGCSSTAEVKDDAEIQEVVTANKTQGTVAQPEVQPQPQQQRQPQQASPAPQQAAVQQPAPAPVQAAPQKQPRSQAKQQRASQGGSGSSQQPQIVQEQRPVERIIVQKQAPRKEKIKITGVGYGAESTYDGFTQGQKRLMAIRASKLDAYRALAEQIYGIKIDSNTSVATLTAQSDSFRARVNAVVKGARVVSITPMADNNYETVLEVFVDRRFFEDVFVYTGNRHENILEPLETCTMGFNCYEAASYR